MNELNTAPTVESVVAELGGKMPEAAAPEIPAVTPETPAADPAAPAVTTPAAEPVASAADPKDAVAAERIKMQQAFAQLRIQNKQYANLIKETAGLVGVDGADEQALMNALKEKITAKAAEDQKVPVELLKRMQALEERDQEYSALQARLRANTGFQAVKDKFGLDQTQLNKFVTDLTAQGMNPFQASNVDLVSQYTVMHHEELLQKAVADAVLAEQNRAATANTHSTTPGSKTGATQGDPGKVNSVRDLDIWLSQNGK